MHAMTAFQVLARTLILTAYTTSLLGPILGLRATGEVAATQYPDVETAGIASGMVAFFLLSSICSILFSTFLFSYRWNLAALAMLAVDMYSHVVTAVYAAGSYPGGASTVYVVYAVIYLTLQLLTLLPLTLAALLADSLTGDHLTPLVTHPHIYELDYRYRMGTGMIFKAAGFCVVVVFVAVAFLITLGSQNGWGPIAFVVFGGVITLVPFLAVAIATGIALSAEDSDLIAAIVDDDGITSHTYIGRYSPTGGLPHFDKSGLPGAPAPSATAVEGGSADTVGTAEDSDTSDTVSPPGAYRGAQHCPRQNRVITQRPMPTGHRISSGIYAHIA
jgi:hypothetical protein